MKIKIIAVDVDGTLCNETCWTEEECLNATPAETTISIVKSLSKTNFIVIWTARKPELANATIEWLAKHNIRYDAISFKKMAADLYIDDKSYNPKSWRGYE